MPYDYAEYDSYGNLQAAQVELNGISGPEAHNEPGVDPVGFCGQWGCYTDMETGLVLMGHRYYNSDNKTQARSKANKRYEEIMRAGRTLK